MEDTKELLWCNMDVGQRSIGGKRLKRYCVLLFCITGVSVVSGCSTAKAINTNNSPSFVHSTNTSSRSKTLKDKNFSVTLYLSAEKEDSNGNTTNTSVKDSRFVVVDELGKVLGVRNGTGKLKIKVAPNGFWDSANKNGGPLGTVGSVEILAYAPKMVDTIMVDVPVSNAPITDNNNVAIPMMSMVNPKGKNTPNEPNIVIGTDSLHHLVKDGVSQYYSKFAHITNSFLRSEN